MITKVLDKVRDHYLQRFVASLNEYRESNSPAACELLIELNREGTRAYKLYRLDMASNASGEFKAQEVNPSTHLTFEPFEEQLGDVCVCLSPIAWNGVELRGWIEVFELKRLEAWALKWLDVDDHNAQDSNGLQGVIHSVTEPKLEGTTLYLSVDFGSAPVTSFAELIGIIGSMGATNAEVSSSCI